MVLGNKVAAGLQKIKKMPEGGRHCTANVKTSKQGALLRAIQNARMIEDLLFLLGGLEGKCTAPGSQRMSKRRNKGKPNTVKAPLQLLVCLRVVNVSKKTNAFVYKS